MAEEQERMSLGQVCFDGLWNAQHTATGAYTLQWEEIPAEVRLWWEAGAQAVKAAVLAEQEGYGATDRRVISPEEMRVQHLMAHIEEAIVRGLSMSQALRLGVQMASAIQVAIRDGIIAGLKAWEGR